MPFPSFLRSEATLLLSEGTKERRNEGTKERRNEGTKERRNEGRRNPPLDPCCFESVAAFPPSVRFLRSEAEQDPCCSPKEPSGSDPSRAPLPPFGSLRSLASLGTAKQPSEGALLLRLAPKEANRRGEGRERSRSFPSEARTLAGQRSSQQGTRRSKGSDPCCSPKEPSGSDPSRAPGDRTPARAPGAVLPSGSDPCCFESVAAFLRSEGTRQPSLV